MKHYYAILGIRRGASARAIKKAYRRRAMKYHPERHGNTDGANERFLDITESYLLLFDPARRAAYDAEIRVQSGAQQGQQDPRHGCDEQPREIPSDRALENAHRIFREEMIELGKAFARTGMDEIAIALKLARAGCPRNLAIAAARCTDQATDAEKSDDGADAREDKPKRRSTTRRKEDPQTASQITEKKTGRISYLSPSLATAVLLVLLVIAALVVSEFIERPRDTASAAFADGMNDYLRSNPTKQDLESARLDFEKAADKGHLRAKTFLGYMLGIGIGGPKDTERSWKLLLEASDGKDRIAQALIAEAYVTSSSLDEVNKGISLMETSAAKGVITSQRWLCDHYTFFGTEERELTTGHFFCMQAVKNDEEIPGWIGGAHVAENKAEASATIAHQYYFGDGVRADEETALRWADSAIGGGATLGYWIKALAYQSGKGVERDFAVARGNFSIAAEAGLSLAQEYYADYLVGGIGGDRDLQSALEWYRKAAIQGESSSQVSLAELLLWNFRSEKGLVEALAWILVAERAKESDKEMIKELKLQILPSMSKEQLLRATEMTQVRASAMAQNSRSAPTTPTLSAQGSP